MTAILITGVDIFDTPERFRPTLQQLRSTCKGWQLDLTVTPLYEAAARFLTKRKDVEVVHIVDELAVPREALLNGCKLLAETIASYAKRPSVSLERLDTEISALLLRHDIRASVDTVEHAVIQRWRLHGPRSHLRSPMLH